MPPGPDASDSAALRQPFASGPCGYLFLGLALYALVAILVPAAFPGTGRAFEVFTLFADLPLYAGATFLAAVAAHSARDQSARRVWTLLAGSLAVYGTGNLLNSVYWYFGHDPFPSVGDVFFLAFYPLLFAAVLAIVRASEVRVPWGRLVLDAMILVLGFGAFFWFFVIRPTAVADSDPDIVKYVLAQAYIALACLMVLTFGVFLMNAGNGLLARRTLVLLTTGFCLMFLADIVWAMSKVTGQYLPGGLSDALYVLCYLPLAAAAREQMRGPPAQTRAAGATRVTLSQALPFAAMLVSFLLLLYFQGAHSGEPTMIMTAIIFALTLLVMLRQGVMLRDEALSRELRAAGLVEARYASLIRNASDVIMITDVKGGLRFVSPAAEHTIGRHPDELIGRNLLDLWGGSDQERLAAFLAEVAASSGRPVGPVELALSSSSGRCTMEAVGSNLLADPAVGGLALNFRDVSERKVLEEQLSQLAFHDPLTLLANRNLFRNRVEHALALAQRSDRRVAVLFLDLDNFKNVNDSHGHGAGDRLLQTAAQRLIMCTRATDTVARLGGDEFAILLEGITSPADVEHIAAMIIDLFRAPLTLDSNDVVITASIGVACSEPEDDTEKLLRNADIAMYSAKAAGKGRYVAFHTSMQEQLHARVRLVQDIHRAAEAKDQFFLEFQPIVDLTSRELLGVETLVRWQHPERGLVMPGEFIAAAEESGQIVEIGKWVLRDACRQIRGWQGSIAAGGAVRVAVNVSGRHLQQPDFINDVRQALEESGLEPGNLVIELTESTIMHNTESNLEKFQELKKLGVRLSIDDFGTGYSSLSYLHRFPIDILKIDRSFVSRLTESGEGPELARAVVMLGETLGLETIAEGIEHEEQVMQLLELGCVAGQGFLFARSCSLEELSSTPFARRRAELRRQQPAQDGLTATGRFRVAGLRASRSLA
jgi:diguanylate cyclase (GGDEF)-like protein/PAS domain S-box-containing protein